MHAGKGELILISNCTCLGGNLTYNCIINGNGFTIWQGSAFNCSSNNDKFTLRHSSFRDEGTQGNCNDGGIEARSLGVSMDSVYTSQVNVTVTIDLIDETIECAHSLDGSTPTSIASSVIKITSGMYIYYN